MVMNFSVFSTDQGQKLTVNLKLKIRLKVAKIDFSPNSLNLTDKVPEIALFNY
jgi:hypothetical protein